MHILAAKCVVPGRTPRSRRRPAWLPFLGRATLPCSNTSFGQSRPYAARSGYGSEGRGGFDGRVPMPTGLYKAAPIGA